MRLLTIESEGLKAFGFTFPEQEQASCQGLIFELLLAQSGSGRSNVPVIQIGPSDSREFYVPKFTPTESNPNLRDVVYWNPEIVTDPEGKASFSFSNSSRAGTYRMVIEGMRLDGRMGRNVIEYELK